jgi:hypothetical protein
MSLTAYVRIRGSYIEEPVTYDLGPVWVTKSLIDGFYTKTGFAPQPANVTGTADEAMVGTGVFSASTTSSDYGAFVKFSAVTSAGIVVPDEMLPSQALRDRVYNMDYLTFYGPAAEGITVTGQSSNTLTLATGHGLYNGQLVTLTTTTTLPAGLTANTLYYIVARAAGAVSFALTPGGSAVTISDAGTGTHKIVPFTVAGEFARNLNPRWSNGQGRLVA